MTSSDTPSRNVSPARVLIIEDHGLVQKSLRLLLSRSGVLAPTWECDSAQGATAFLEETRPDLIIADLLLPDADGTDVVEQVREAVPGVPILVVSGKADLPLIRKVLRAGANGYVAKGKSPEILPAAKTLLQGGRYCSEDAVAVNEAPSPPDASTDASTRESTDAEGRSGAADALPVDAGREGASSDFLTGRLPGRWEALPNVAACRHPTGITVYFRGTWGPVRPVLLLNAIEAREAQGGDVPTASARTPLGVTWVCVAVGGTDANDEDTRRDGNGRARAARAENDGETTSSRTGGSTPAPKDGALLYLATRQSGDDVWAGATAEDLAERLQSA